jgi:hypothetical protein
VIVLAIIAIAVLLVLVVASMRMEHETGAAERQDADVRAHAGDAQEEESLSRRAEVRGATDERTG